MIFALLLVRKWHHLIRADLQKERVTDRLGSLQDLVVTVVAEAEAATGQELLGMLPTTASADVLINGQSLPSSMTVGQTQTQGEGVYNCYVR